MRFSGSQRIVGDGMGCDEHIRLGTASGVVWHSRQAKQKGAPLREEQMLGIPRTSMQCTCTVCSCWVDPDVAACERGTEDTVAKGQDCQLVLLLIP